MRPQAFSPVDTEEVSERTLDPDGMYPAQEICGGMDKMVERLSDDAEKGSDFNAKIAELVADVQDAQHSLAPSEGSPVEFEIERAVLHLSQIIADARDDRTKQIVVYAIQAARACERLRARTNHEPAVRHENHFTTGRVKAQKELHQAMKVAAHRLLPAVMDRLNQAAKTRGKKPTQAEIYGELGQDLAKEFGLKKPRCWQRVRRYFKAG